MIKIAICDEKNKNIGEIETRLVNISIKRCIPMDTMAFVSAQELKKAIEQKEYFDLIYINTQILNEMVQIQEIQPMLNNSLFIYMLEHDQKMAEIFGVCFAAFMIMPIGEQAFERIFMEANRIICKQKMYFHFHYRNEEHKILCNDILYFASNGRLIEVRLQEGKCESFYGKLSEVEKEVHGGKIPFLRIHQSYLVNYHYIVSHSKSEVTLSNGIKLPISISKQECFQEQYNSLK